MSEPDSPIHESPMYREVIETANAISKLFDGRDMAVISAALAEATSRWIVQLHEADRTAAFDLWSDTMWNLVPVNEAIFKDRIKP